MKLRLPEWLVKPEVRLPKWAELEPLHSANVSMKIVVDPELAYAEWFALLHDPKYPVPEGMAHVLALMPDVDQPDQYWIEVAYQCSKLDLQSCLAGTRYDPRVSGQPVEFKFKNTPKYKLTNWPEGKGWQQASQGKQARLHYQRVRGALPM